MLSDTIDNDTVDCIQTATGYQIKLNGIEIGFISYHEKSGGIQGGNLLQWAAMMVLKEKQRQEKEFNRV